MPEITREARSTDRSSRLPPHDEGAADSLSAVLVAQPSAWVGAMGRDALLYVDVPEGAPFAGHRVLRGRWVLDHVVAADRPAIGAAWRDAHVHGEATVSAEVLGGGTATFRFFDATAEHGKYIVVAVEDGDAKLVTANLESHALAPRHCRVLREESGTICEVDDAAELVLGWSPRELLAALPLTYFHPDDHLRIIDTWMAVLGDTSNRHRCRAVPPTGQHLDVARAHEPQQTGRQLRAGRM